MGRLLAGGMAALLLVAGGLFWWQGRASNEPAPQLAFAAPPPPAVESLPEGDPDAVGAAPPPPDEAASPWRASRAQSNRGPGSDLRPGAIQLWPMTPAAGICQRSMMPRISASSRSIWSALNG